MPRAAQPVPFVKRLRLKNYKSIADCDVALGPLTVLIGLNAAGKSNFLDALRFVADALTRTVAQTVADRGGISSVLRQANSGASKFMSIELELEMSSPARDVAEMLDTDVRTVSATYGFELRASEDDGPADALGSMTVEREWCSVAGFAFSAPTTFLVRRGQVVEGPDYLRGPVADPSSLMFPAAAHWISFAAMHAALRSMSFHVVNPSVMRRVEVRTGKPTLGVSGERLGEVLGYLAEHFPPVKRRIDDYISAIAPGALGIDEYALDRYGTVRLRADDPTTPGGVRYFGPESISDGTLSAAGLLAALFQPDSLNGRLPLVAVEEPELGLHPTAAGALFDALTEASEHVQVIAATQSADLLDRKEFAVDWARVVQMRDGVTYIGEVDDGSREVVSRGLATLGELLRSNQLTPRPAPPSSPTAA